MFSYDIDRTPTLARSNRHLWLIYEGKVIPHIDRIMAYRKPAGREFWST